MNADTKPDHVRAMEWATNDMHNHHSADCDECNLAAAYLELRELAKAVLLADTVTVHDEDILALRKALEIDDAT